MRTSRRGTVDPFIVMDVVEAARAAEAAGRDIVHMEVGQPGTSAPQGARAAVADAFAHDTMGYTTSLGIPALRERIARLYKDWYNLDLDPARVVVTAGSSAGFVLAFTALFEAGEKVAIGAPGYPSYRQILKALTLEPVLIPSTAENRLQPAPEQLPGDIAGLLVASPGNPTGTMLDRPQMTALIDACRSRGAAFISDEIYHGIEYEKKAVTALEISDEVYVINSFSKYFSMTGWRIGWMVVPADHVRTIERLTQNMYVCAPHVSQIAALAALDCEEELQANLEVYRQNRALLLKGLPEAGFTRIAPPDGAFYIYADVSEITDDSRALADDILQKAGVALTPGLDFDPVRGAGTLRFSYAQSTERIREGLARLADFMAQRG